MRLLIIQNTVQKKITDSLKNVDNILSKVTDETIDFIVLPEMFTTPYEVERFEAYSQTDTSETITHLQHLAQKYNAYVIGGSVPEKTNTHLYNTSYILNRKGKIIHKYRKIHLFAITYPNGETFDERDTLNAGNRLGVFETEFGKMGVMICFDIRYPLLAQKLTNAQVSAIFVPGAFNQFTGPLHWETTFKARAIDNQLFMIGCSASSASYGNYQTYGHSLIVDPLGSVIDSLKDQEGYLDITIDLEDIPTVRNKLPIQKMRKPL